MAVRGVEPTQNASRPDNKAYILRTGYGAFQKAGKKVRRQAA